MKQALRGLAFIAVAVLTQGLASDLAYAGDDLAGPLQAQQLFYREPGMIGVEVRGGEGMLTLSEVAKELGVSQSTVGCWRRHSLLRAHPYNAKNECLYEPLDENAPVKQQGLSLSDPRRSPQRRVESNGRGAV